MNHRLENEKVSSLLFSLALPSILAQLATLIYNMVDRIYIGRLPDGGLSIAGIGLCTSIITGVWQLKSKIIQKALMYALFFCQILCIFIS